MKEFIVYKYTNKYNGMIYIGITCQGLEKRWQTGYKNNKRLQFIIDKYGKDAFIREVLYDHLTKEEACELEIKTIKELNATDPKIGYNISFGGTAPMYNRHHTEELKKKYSETRKGQNNSFYGKHHDRNKMPNNIPVICLNTEQIFNSIILASEHMIKNGNIGCTYQNIANAVNEKQMYAGKTKTGEFLFWSRYDKSKSIEYYKKLLDEKKNKKYEHVLPFKNKVVDIINNIVYEGAKEAAEIIGCHHSKITSCCNGIRATCNGTVFLYEKEAKLLSAEEKFDIVMERWEKSKGDPIVCLNTGKLYKSKREGALDVGLKTPDGIIKYLNGKSEFAGIGNNQQFLKWVLYKDYIKMSDEEIQNIVDKPVSNHWPVHCITTNKYFMDASNAAQFYHTYISGIHKSCRKENETSGTYNGKKLKWEYDTQYRWNLYIDEQWVEDRKDDDNEIN